MIFVTTKREVPIGHRLLGYAGRCAYLHGHNYVFEVTVGGVVDEMGFVIDFKDLKKGLDSILDQFDHAMVLNVEDPAVPAMAHERVVLLNVNPSAENLASLVFGLLRDKGFTVVSVVVRETEDGWAKAEEKTPRPYVALVSRS